MEKKQKQKQNKTTFTNKLKTNSIPSLYRTVQFRHSFFPSAVRKLSVVTSRSSVPVENLVFHRR